MSKMGNLNLEIQEKIGQLTIEGRTPSEIVEAIWETFKYKVSEYWVRQQMVSVG